MSREKAIELLEECKNTQLAKEHTGDMEKYMEMVSKRHNLVLQALAELEKPEPCKTCGGSGQVPMLCVECPVVEKDQCISKCPTKPCPDCKPEPTEFMKRMEEKYNAIDAWDYEKQNYSEVVGDLHEACDLIDRQAAENKALEDKIRLMEQESINHA